VTAACAIATRELRSFFRVPAGWVIVALYLFLTGIVFGLGTLQPGAPATLRDFFSASGLLLMGIAPAISMRLFSEELRSGTAEALLTAPVGDLAVVLGKYLGGALFLVVLLAPTLVYPLILALVSDPRPDPGPIGAGYLALLLLGLYFLAVGTLASALTNNQTLAYLGAMLALVVLTLVTGQAAERAPAPISQWLIALSVTRRMNDFAKGVIDLAHVVFLLSLAAWFLTLAHAALDSRRWR